MKNDLILQAVGLGPRGGAYSTTTQTLSLLQAHGFVINTRKCSLIPSTEIVHLGVDIDTFVAKVYPSLARFKQIQNLISIFTRKRRQSLAQSVIYRTYGVIYRNYTMEEIPHWVSPEVSTEDMEHI